MKNTFWFLILIVSTNISALPIDWHGKFGVNTILHTRSSYLDLKSNSTSIDDGSQEIKLSSNNDDEISAQTYLFTLAPDILVNDAVTIHSELSSGYARGGSFGSNSTQNSSSNNGNLSNALYPYNFSGTNSSLLIHKLYMELFTDSATYQIGRFYNHFGLGVIVNSGENDWDRFAYARDGIKLKVQIGNFHINPFWSRLVAGNEASDSTSIKEFGTSLIYDNMDRDIVAGVLFLKKQASKFNTFLSTTATSDGSAKKMGATSTTLIDLYLHKKMNKFDLKIEAPIFSGNIGTLRSAETKYQANAIIAKTNYNFSDSWTIGIDFGKVSGDKGDKTKYTAMYLNPNFQIANVLFRYNRHALANTSTDQNLFDSYINNVTYLKLKTQLNNEKWTWNFAFIYAKAIEVASTSQTSAFNHLTNKYFTPAATQSNDLGFELDADFHYAYNDELSFVGSFGWLKTGDYFAFTNTATKNSLKNPIVLTLGTSVAF